MQPENGTGRRVEVCVCCIEMRAARIICLRVRQAEGRGERGGRGGLR